MGLSEQWNDTGKELGDAVEGLGKTIIKSVRTAADKVDDWAENDGKPTNNYANAKESTVFNDGTWNATGKKIGSAFVSLGKTMISSVEVGADMIGDAIKTEPKKEEDDSGYREVKEEATDIKEE